MKFVTSVVAALFISMNLFAQSSGIENNAELPTTSITDLRKESKVKTVPFNSIIEKDKVTLVCFWATWCVPCIGEIKEIAKKLPEWKKEADFNFIIISLDGSRDKGKAMNYAISQQWDFPSYIDPNSDLMRSLNFPNPPYSIVFDKNGKIVYRHLGYELGGEDEVFAEIKKHAK